MYEPRIVCFLCKWCTSAGADLAGTSRIQYTPSGVNIRFMCSSRVDPEHVLWAFRQGADGVLIGGCHPGDCHYQDGNYRTQARTALLHRLLDEFGIDPRRLRLEWISAAEGRKFAAVMDEFTQQLRGMGPMRLAAREIGNG
jgi:F420-non-reducing hydrogenase iron-sulfur subunit